jgi:hypothetical protein
MGRVTLFLLGEAIQPTRAFSTPVSNYTLARPTFLTASHRRILLRSRRIFLCKGRRVRCPPLLSTQALSCINLKFQVHLFQIQTGVTRFRGRQPAQKLVFITTSVRSLVTLAWLDKSQWYPNPPPLGYLWWGFQFLVCAADLLRGTKSFHFPEKHSRLPFSSVGISRQPEGGKQALYLSRFVRPPMSRDSSVGARIEPRKVCLFGQPKSHRLERQVDSFSTPSDGQAPRERNFWGRLRPMRS